MKLHIKDIENRNVKNDGSWGTFFYKEKKFTGKIYDTWGDEVSWIFDVENGLQNGIEKTYYEGTNVLEQIAEYKDNMQFGISKEFDETGELLSVSIVWNNSYLKTIFVNSSKVLKTDNFYDLDQKKYPEKILQYLNLSNDDLMIYDFNKNI